MEFTFELESVIRGHHVFKSIWTPAIGETLPLNIEDGNSHDPNAVAIIKDSTVVGHAPREVARVFYFFLTHDGTIHAEVIGHRRFGRGLEVPCRYILQGKPKYIKRAKKLLQNDKNEDTE